MVSSEDQVEFARSLHSPGCCLCLQGRYLWDFCPIWSDPDRREAFLLTPWPKRGYFGLAIIRSLIGNSVRASINQRNRRGIPSISWPWDRYNFKKNAKKVGRIQLPRITTGLSVPRLTFREFKPGGRWINSGEMSHARDRTWICCYRSVLLPLNHRPHILFVFLISYYIAKTGSALISWSRGLVFVAPGGPRGFNPPLHVLLGRLARTHLLPTKLNVVTECSQWSYAL